MAKGSMIKRLAALAMTLALFICAAATAHAAQSEYGDIDRLYSRDGNESIYISESKYLYNFKGDYPGVTVCGYAGDSKDLKIPLIINGREVTAIDNDSFVGDERIESVTFTGNIKTIGKNCFNGCTNLRTVNLSSGVSEFNQVFCDCTALESMVFPQGVHSIQDSFKNCTSLSYIKFARSVTSIGEYSFTGCHSLRKIDWLGGIVRLGNAFDGCTSLQSVTIPEGVVLIDGAFDGCTALNEVTFPQTLLYITGGFTNCSSLTKIELPEKLLFVNEAFNNCESLSRLKYSEATAISDTAFLRCPKLTIEKDNRFILTLLGWLGIIAVMILAGYVTFRVLTRMADNLSRQP